MGQLIARGTGSGDEVTIPHGIKTNGSCPTPIGKGPYTDKANTKNVFVEGYAVVVKGNAMKSHKNAACTDHAPGLSTFSGTVKINGLGVGRLGDEYAGEKITKVDQSTVKAG